MYCAYCHQEFGSSNAHEHNTEDCPHQRESQRRHDERKQQELREQLSRCSRCSGSGEIRHGGIGYDPFDHMGDGYTYVTCSTCGGTGRRQN